MFIKHGQLLFKLSVIILNSQQLLHTDEPMLSIQDHTLNFGEKKSFGHLQACGHFHFRSVNYTHRCRYSRRIRGGSRGGGAPGGCPPKIGKNMIFWRKIVIFSHEIPQKFSRLPPQLEKISFFWCKIVIFHTKYSKNFRASIHSAQFFLSAPP